MIETKVCIVGAGPAGVSAALHLSYAGIPSVLVDKAVFPRDKICGDGINGKIPDLIKQLDPLIYERFRQNIKIHTGTWGIRFFAFNSLMLEAPFFKGYDPEKDTPPGYICRRYEFDNFFIHEVKRRSNIDFYDNTSIEKYERTEKGFVITNKDGSFKLHTNLLIIANGSDSMFARHYTGNKILPAHHAAAIRGYFTGVEGFHKDNFVEFYFLDQINPGYLWIFPQGNGTANVGLGVRSDFISKKKMNLKKLLTNILQEHPVLAPRFKDAALVNSKLIGHSVPFGSKKRIRSGDCFMLAGDAAHLVDPLTGGGIANSFLSGKLAAEQAERCVEQNNFSAPFIQLYDKEIQKQIGHGMRQSYILQRLLRYPFVVRTVIDFVSKRPRLFDQLSRLQMRLVAGK